MDAFRPHTSWFLVRTDHSSREIAAIAIAALLISGLSLIVPTPSAAQVSDSSRLGRILGTPGNATPADDSAATFAAPETLSTGTNAIGSGGAFRGAVTISGTADRIPTSLPSALQESTSRRTLPRTAIDRSVVPASLQQPTPADAPLLPGSASDDETFESILPAETYPLSPSYSGDDSAPISPLLEPIPDGLTHHGPRIMKVNPLAVQQGVANLTLQGEQQIPRESLGFPFSALPDHWGHRIPRLQFEFDLPDQRHVGRGDPLVGTSWRNRPLHLDGLTGGIFPGDLIGGQVESQNGLLTGVRLGWDMNHYLGGELRLAQADVGLVGRNDRADIRLYDITLNYFPWGDSRIRPFTSLGFGVGQFSFIDANGTAVDETMMTMPFGVGLKYYLRPNIALRTEFMDTLAFGSQVLDTVHSLSVTAGMEFRFGGHRRNYYPYQSSPRVW